MEAVSFSNSTSECIVDEIIDEIAPQRRLAAALRLSARLKASLPPRTAAVFDRAVLRIVEAETEQTRGAVANSLADVASGPAGTVAHLAGDPSARVAAPLLQRSPLVPEPVLVSVARTRGEEHLVAIAARPQLSPRVVDIVVARGTWPVLRTVAANRTATLTPGSLARLLRLSRGDGHITVALARHPDTPTAARRDLAEQFKALALAGRPTLRGEDSGLDLDLDTTGPLDPLAIEAAADWLSALQARRRPTWRDLERSLQEGGIARVVAVLAALCGEPVPPVVEAFRRRDLARVVLLARMANLDWALAKRLLASHFGAQAWSAIAAQREGYERLSTRTATTALRAMRFRTTARPVEGGRARGSTEA